MAKIGSKGLYILIGVLIVIFLPPFAKYLELQHKNKKLEQKIEELKKENKRLELDKYRLETDIAYIEKKAREKIGMVRKGEFVLKDVEKR